MTTDVSASPSVSASNSHPGRLWEGAVVTSKPLELEESLEITGPLSSTSAGTELRSASSFRFFERNRRRDFMADKNKAIKASLCIMIQELSVSSYSLPYLVLDGEPDVR